MKKTNPLFFSYNSAGSKSVGIVRSKAKTTCRPLPMTGNPYSVLTKTDNSGEIIMERYYDKDGKAYLDIDYTNHGNASLHPVIPHEHPIIWDESGIPIRQRKGEKIND